MTEKKIFSGNLGTPGNILGNPGTARVGPGLATGLLVWTDKSRNLSYKSGKMTRDAHEYSC